MSLCTMDKTEAKVMGTDLKEKDGKNGEFGKKKILTCGALHFRLPFKR